MAVTFNGKVSVLVEGNYQNDTDTVFGAINKTISRTIIKSLTNGTGSGQANLVYAAINATAGDGAGGGSKLNIDVYPAVTDALGNLNVNFEKVVAILIENLSTTIAANIGNAGVSANMFLSGNTDTLLLPPEGVLLLLATASAGYNIGAGSKDVITIAAASGSITVNVLILGRTADS